MTTSDGTIELGLSLGSNLGDRLHQLQTATSRVLEVPGTKLVAKSPIYETEPVGVRPEYQDLAYYNCVLVIQSPDSAGDWLTELQTIEADMGRVRGDDRFSPRPIDIDILFAGDECVDGKDLSVPHPRWAKRRFVVCPLADVKPDLVLPGQHKTVSEVMQDLSEDGEAVQRIVEVW